MKQHKTIFFQKNKRYNNNSATFEICPVNGHKHFWIIDSLVKSKPLKFSYIFNLELWRCILISWVGGHCNKGNLLFFHYSISPKKEIKKN